MIPRLFALVLLAISIHSNSAFAQSPPALVTLSGEFIESQASLALQKPIEDAAIASASESWSMNCWVWIEKSQDDSAIIAGFGDGEDKPAFTLGRERFITTTKRGIKFWGCGRDLQTNISLDLKR